MSGWEWRDGGRTVAYGDDAAAMLARFGWDTDVQLLTTARADPGLMPAIHVADGQVPDLAAGLLDGITAQRLVAWGGGRVIDVAKALASARGGEVCAVPTTLSGAEMTLLHRKITGLESRPSVRPILVIADRALMTSMPEAALRASSLNALAHGVEALYGPRANPVATMLALRGAELIAGGELAFGSLLCGYAVDSAGYAVHHVLCQTAVRTAGTGHAQTNAAVLPQTIRLMQERAPEALAPLADAVGVAPGQLAGRVDDLGGRARIAIEPPLRETVADAAMARPELADTPGPPVTREELLEMLAGAST
ncbi:MAG TPA: iron-containing alcohol dehydrogenase [Gaiellales bacterium]|nr:iron-containing alcohol dehydrogenase [Gaiellales bacterium]